VARSASASGGGGPAPTSKRASRAGVTRGIRGGDGEGAMSGLRAAFRQRTAHGGSRRLAVAAGTAEPLGAKTRARLPLMR